MIDDIKLKLLTDKKFFIENLINIPNKNRVSVPFKFNKVQNMLYNGLQELQSSNRMPRAIVLKAGQMGITSLIVALFLVDCITKPNTTSVIIAHEDFITQRLLNKAKMFEESIPKEFKPEIHHRSSYEMAWEDINSVFYIGSARSFVFGRGERIDNALCSEIAFWSDPDRIMIPLGERVPRNGTLILESTPNGEGNYFHKVWLEASTGWNSGRSIFKPFFFPWWLCEDYQLSPEEGLPADRVITYTAEEQYLVQTHGLTENQIRWRRMKLASPLGNMFFQEYAEDPQSCFIQISDSVFNIDILNKKLLDCYPAPASYYGADIWYPAEEGHTYIIGVDPTAGVHDPAAATIWDTKGLKLVARIHGVYEPMVLADKLSVISKYYNNAILVIENNGAGIAVINALQGTNSNLYYHRDLVTGKITNRIGWTTSAQSKTYMIHQFRQLLPSLTIHDEQLIREAKNLRYNGAKVESIGPDDLIMSAMIAIAARDAVPQSPAFIGVSGWQTW